MTIPYLTLDQFVALLKENGYIVADDSFFETHNRLILQKDGHDFPIQCPGAGKVLYFPLIVKTCLMLGIEAPEEHKKCFDQIEAAFKAKKEDK